MDNNKKILRMIYPQWQGGIVSHWMPDIVPEESSRGYFLGAMMLNMLAPETSQKTVQVPVSLDISERKIENGIMDYKIITEQTKSALNILNENAPDKIVILGGECSVSVVPFSYLAKKYEDDLAIVWIDAHPDINLPYDDYKGYHAMALTAIMGMGDENLINMLPAKVNPSKVIIIGLRSWDKGMAERQRELGIKSLAVQETANDSSKILSWLKSSGVSKVAVHIDLDAIDPDEMLAGVGIEPNGMKIDEIVRIVNDINEKYDITGITIAEHMPRIAIKLKNMLSKLPLLK